MLADHSDRSPFSLIRLEDVVEVSGFRFRPAFTILSFFIALIGGYYSIAMPASAQEPAGSHDVVPPERRGYEVRLLVALDESSFDAPSSLTILREVGQAATRCAGELWAVKTNQITWLSPASQRGLERLDQTVLFKQYPDESADVWFAASVESLPVGFRVSVRSWQPDVQLETPIQSVDLHDRREIAVALLRLCRDLMRPMGVVENVTKKTARIRLRAGELTPPDPSFNQLKKDDLLLPMLAYRDKNKVIERLQTIPWTYISVEEIENSTVQGTIESGLKSPLSGKKRGRIDTLVVALRPQYPSTQIELLTQTKPRLPLVAHRIEVRTSFANPQPTKEHPEIDPSATLIRELLTDRRGLTHLMIEPDHRLVWLFAYSGENLLARVPCVPGISRILSLEVPDDSTRLTAEADLQMLQGEVIDAVALRNTAIATMRSAAKKDDWNTVTQKLTLLKRQQDAGSLNDRLIAVRVAGTAAAKARKDRVTEVRINRICDDTASLIKTHLSDETLRLLIEEMEALQSANSAKESP